eukprot:5149359-Prymnesium_polylepis.1
MKRRSLQTPWIARVRAKQAYLFEEPGVFEKAWRRDRLATGAPWRGERGRGPAARQTERGRRVMTRSDRGGLNDQNSSLISYR